MNKALFQGHFHTQGAFPLVIGGKWCSPCLIDEPGVGYQVSGEVFTVTDEELIALDQLESTHRPDGYRRIIIGVKSLKDNTTLEVWTYVKERAVIEGIHSEPLENYALDPHYIIPSNRPS